VIGFGPSLVLDTAVRIVAAELADEERDLPEGVDVLALHSLIPTLWPDQ
jgi:hypothetical protein